MLAEVKSAMPARSLRCGGVEHIQKKLVRVCGMRPRHRNCHLTEAEARLLTKWQQCALAGTAPRRLVEEA
eukprot:4856694-Alexandrium_andersonii.AAC.1